jgi:hypothetical protein
LNFFPGNDSSKRLGHRQGHCGISSIKPILFLSSFECLFAKPVQKKIGFIASSLLDFEISRKGAMAQSFFSLLVYVFINKPIK